MKKEALSDKEVVHLLNQHFVSIRLNCYKEKEEKIARKIFSPNYIPSIGFLTATGEKIKFDFVTETKKNCRDL